MILLAVVMVMSEARIETRSTSLAGVCDHAANKLLCLPPNYSKFELPFTNSVNVVEIGIDILDVLRINDKVGVIVLPAARAEDSYSCLIISISLINLSYSACP